MSVIYKCDRPGCGTETDFEMRKESITIREGGTDRLMYVHLCYDCWAYLQMRRIELETKFYKGLREP